MDKRIITCTSIGVYGQVITKGRSYEVVAEDDEKYRIIGNQNRRIWINKYYFVEGKVDIPILQSWT